MPANSIELNQKPLVLLERGVICETCKGEYHITQEGTPPVCVLCSLYRSKADYIIAFGWKILRTQRTVIAVPLKTETM